MTLDRYSTGTRFEDLAGYSRAVADEDFIYISGTVGSDPVSGTMPETIEEQLANIFSIAETTLVHFGAGFADVTRTRVFLTSIEVLMPIAAALKERFAECPPANTTLICGIPAPGAMVEIEFTARRPS